MVGFREAAPPHDLRKRSCFHNLPRFDPPLHEDLHAQRIVGFHDDPDCCRGGDLDVLFAIVAEPYDPIVGNAEINALVRSLTASAKLTQPLMRHDDASR